LAERHLTNLEPGSSTTKIPNGPRQELSRMFFCFRSVAHLILVTVNKSAIIEDARTIDPLVFKLIKAPDIMLKALHITFAHADSFERRGETVPYLPDTEGREKQRL
jgi:hypothetical protein